MELRILDALQTIHTPLLDKCMIAITNLGGNAGIIWIVLTIALLIYPKTRKSGSVMAVALIVNVIICNVILKNLVARPRPCDVNVAVQLLVARPYGYSFPSGHTSAAFTAVAALYMAGKKKGWKIVLVVAVLIAFSRLYLYVHYPTDVLGGIVFGILSGVIGYYIVKKINEWKNTKRSVKV